MVLLSLFLTLSTNIPCLEGGGLWASHHLYPGYERLITGPGGQDCTQDTGDFPDQCSFDSLVDGVITNGEVKLSNIDGKIECGFNFDCCVCAKMICGPECVSITCNGDSSCYGVKHIELIGDALGATLNCNGDISCKWTNVYGTNVAALLCTGDGACAFSNFDVDCISEPEGCTLLCVGDDSCRSHPDLLPEKMAYFNIRGSMGMKCAHDACKDATFFMMENVGGNVMCYAEESCMRADITINTIGLLGCRAEYACQGAHIYIRNPEEGFSILCSGRGACENLEVEIYVDDPDISHFRGITCMSAHSCRGMHVTITKTSGILEIEELMCGAAESCRNAVFDIGPNVEFADCLCAGKLTLACDNLLGVDSCMAGMNHLECLKPNECKGMVETLTNPGNDFELVCGDIGSCQGMELTVYMDGRRRGVTRFGGVQCLKDNSCSGLVYNVFNIIRPIIDVGIVNCEKPGSCVNATFNLIGAKADVSCGDASACTGCSRAIEHVCTECNAPTTPCIAMYG